MKNKAAQSPTHITTSQVNATMALPLQFFIHLISIVIDLWKNLPVMNAVWRERRELETLIDQQIKDLGLTPDCVKQETKKGFFDIPYDRMRSYRSVKSTR